MDRSENDGKPRVNFEEALGRLEEVVEKLQGGGIPLEDAIGLFEEGVRLLGMCSKKLDEAEKRVEILVKGKDGLFKTKPFGQDGGEAQGDAQTDSPDV